MSGFSQPIGRVSSQTASFSLLSRLQADQTSLLTLSQQLSSGKRLTQASDDPTAAVGIMRINQQVASNTQYSSNLNFASNALKLADSTLGSVSTLVSSAQSVASSMIGTGTTADERTSEASVIDGYISQLMSAANTQYENQSLFGGLNSTQPAFVGAGSGYKYQGTSQGQSMLLPGGSSLEYTIDGSTAFGGVASQVGGGQSLNVAITGNTKLSDLNGARSLGVTNGVVNVTVGGTSVGVDLSTAATVSDVVNQLNAGLTAAGSSATVGLSGGGFVVNGDTTQPVTIADAGSGHMAADLGLSGTFASAVATPGGNVGAKVTATTPLSALNNGAGLDPSGFVITSGPKSATITLAGLNSVQDLVNAINGSGTNVTAKINATGSGIEIANAVSGVPLTIGENGGLTATQLGIRSLNAGTKLTDLNNGTGVTFASATHTGATGNLVVTETNGTQFTVKVDGITTQSQLIAAINSASGGTVTGALNASGNGITLTDTSGGGGNVSVAAGSNYQPNGSDFGIIGTGAGGTLTGKNATLGADDLQITRRDGSAFTVNLTGANTIQDVLNKINGADGNTGATRVSAQMNPNGNGIELVDNSSGGGALTVTGLNGSSAAQQLGILKTATSPTSTINGDDVNPVEPQGLFSSLTMLRNALLNNDTAGITRAGQLLQADGTRVIAANGIVGAREQDIAQRQQSVTDEQTQLQSSLSLLQDTDMTTVIMQFQQLQTAYQAALQVGAKQDKMSLMDFVQ